MESRVRCLTGSKIFVRRKQRVAVRGSYSNWTDVISGVLQGSVLGPTLFIMYVNDLPDYIKSSLGLFADDTKIYRPIRGVRHEPNLGCTKISNL